MSFWPSDDRGARTGLLAYSATVLALFLPYLLGADPQVLSLADGDVDRQYFAWRVFGFSELAAGRWPFWNPYIYGGAPYFAGFQAALLYPVNWLHLAFSTARAINLEILIHVWAAGVFMGMWVRGLGVSALGATVAAFAFGLSGPVVARVMPGHLSNLATIAWTPLILLAIDRAAVTGRPRWIVSGALAYALHLLGGHPQYAYYVGMMLVLYIALRIATLPNARLRQCGIVCLIPALGSLLAAAQWLPGAWVMSETLRDQQPFDFASKFYFHVKSLGLLLLPNSQGGLAGLPYVGEPNYWEQVPFFGLIALGFALTAAGRVAVARIFVVLVVVAVILALGKQIPLVYEALYQWLPLFSSFRGVGKFLFCAVLFAGPLVGFGFDAIVRSDGTLSRCSGQAMRRILVGLGAAIGLLTLGAGAVGTLGVDDFLAGFAKIEMHPFARVGEQPYFALGVLAVAWGVLKLGHRRPWSGLVLAALAAVESARFTSGVLSGHGVEGLQSSIAAPSEVETRLSDARLVLPSDQANNAMLARRPGVLGSDPFPLRRYMELLALSQGDNPDSVGQAQTLDDLSSPILRLVRLEGDARLLPEFRTVHDVVVAPDRPRAFTALSQPNYDPERIAVVESGVATEAVPAGQSDSVQVLGREPGRTELEVTMAAPGVLVTSTAFAAGWRARSARDNRTYDVVPVNHAFVGVPLDRGHHHLVLSYQPLGLKLGIGLSGAAAIILIGLAWRRRPVAVARLADGKGRIPRLPSWAGAAGAAVAISGGAFLMVADRKLSQFPFPKDASLGWIQPLRAPNQYEQQRDLKDALVVLGDEAVRSDHLPLSATFAGLLNAVNAGFDATVIYQQFGLFERFIAPEKPHGVILVVGSEAILSRAEFAALAHRPLGLIDDFQRSRRLASFLERRENVDASNLPAQAWHDWSESVLRFNAALGRRLLLTYLPSPSTLLRGQGASLGSKLAAWARDVGIDYLDLTPALGSAPDLAYEKVWSSVGNRRLASKARLTAAGHARIATAIAAHLSQGKGTISSSSVALAALKHRQGVARRRLFAIW